MKLSMLKTGDEALILSVDHPDDIRDQMMANGICTGARLRVEEVSKLHKMMYLNLEGRLMAIRLSRTTDIQVNKLG